MINIRIALLIAATAIASGCTSMAPTYTAPVANVDAAAKLPASVSVGKFGFAPGQESSLNSVGARAQTFNSPTDGSYAEYVAEAAKADLRAAGKLNLTSPLVLTGTLEKNYLSAAGFNTNDAEISVRFKLAEGSRVAFEKTVTAKHEWESSFIGAIARPRAIQNYVVTVQKLLNSLYSDPEFSGALSKK
ncbi:MAG TPA: hypothetical protein VGI57_10120 [Usitatibacter sp.]